MSGQARRNQPSGRQLIEGDLFTAPARNRYHQDISRNLTLIIGNYLEAHPIGKLYDAPFDVFLDEINVYQPNLSFISEANDILTETGASGAPDFIIEILSPKTAQLDEKTKRRAYARCGVKELWLIDPDRKLIHVYFLQRDPERIAATHSENETFVSPQFPGLNFDGARIFRR